MTTLKDFIGGVIFVTVFILVPALIEPVVNYIIGG